ncbi:hypothetical protein TUM12370_33770 [Salmonella enterica subsp. enterica serovar Choleraesuis]|nr:hypothetical protein TUM12370_33770 [Salmonella enterica subsp. enterica serovar Choleraesuis]
MALKQQHTAKKMTFGDHRDLNKVVASTAPAAAQKRVNFNMDEEKHMRFKAACARRGVSISDVMNGLADRWLAENE